MWDKTRKIQKDKARSLMLDRGYTEDQIDQYFAMWDEADGYHANQD